MVDNHLPIPGEIARPAMVRTEIRKFYASLILVGLYFGYLRLRRIFFLAGEKNYIGIIIQCISTDRYVPAS
jgi:hypothetical protein